MSWNVFAGLILVGLLLAVFAVAFVVNTVHSVSVWRRRRMVGPHECHDHLVTTSNPTVYRCSLCGGTRSSEPPPE